MHIQTEEEQDWPNVQAVIKSAFERSAEAHLVAALRQQAQPVISLVAEHGNAIIGHIMFSPVVLTGRPEFIDSAL
mgnify:CR=1 FL=1